jgi:hypothetical protein
MNTAPGPAGCTEMSPGAPGGASSLRGTRWKAIAGSGLEPLLLEAVTCAGGANTAQQARAAVTGGRRRLSLPA